MGPRAHALNSEGPDASETLEVNMGSAVATAS